MTIWILIGALTLATSGLLLRPLARSAKPAMGVVLIFLVAALGFYAWRGNPNIQSAPAPQPAPPASVRADFERQRQILLQNPGAVEGWVGLSEALVASNETAEAVEALHVALGAMPDQPNLWIAQGMALMAHSNGMITPAARLAFDRASLLAPGHPAPRYYVGLAWLQAGRPREALAEWESLAKDSKPTAPWMPDLTRKINAARTMIAAGVGDPVNAR